MENNLGFENHPTVRLTEDETTRKKLTCWVPAEFHSLTNYSTCVGVDFQVTIVNVITAEIKKAINLVTTTSINDRYIAKILTETRFSAEKWKDHIKASL